MNIQDNYNARRMMRILFGTTSIAEAVAKTERVIRRAETADIKRRIAK